MLRAAALLLLCALPLPALAQDAGGGKDDGAAVEVRRPKAIEVVEGNGPPAGIESRATLTFSVRLKGGYGNLYPVLADPFGDVFFPDDSAVKMRGDIAEVTLDFPGDDGNYRVDLIAVGPKGEEEVASFTVAVGVAPKPKGSAVEDGSGGTGVVPTPESPSGGPPPPSNPEAGPSAGELLLRDRRAASRALVEELSRVRGLKGKKPVIHDERIHIVCMEVAREMGRKGRFGPKEVSMKPSTRASVFHGWGMGIYDNYTGSYKSIFSPADVIKRLGGSLAKGSMFGSSNVGGFGMWENSRNPAEVYIVMGLSTNSKAGRIVAAQKKIADARKKLGEAEGKDREKLVKSIAGLRSIETAAFLAEVLETDPDDTVRTIAASALRDLRDPSIVDPLIKGLDTAEGDLAKHLGGCLERVTGRRYGPDAERWRNWWAADREFFKRRK
jgi:hypothetical protein